MWTIRQDQAEAFRQHHLQKFEDEMVEHLKKFAPQHCRAAGEPAVRRVIRMGIENAGRYGFTNRGPVRFYIELMFMFGSYFDTDPQYPWATTALNDLTYRDQGRRADRLFRAMNRYGAQVRGPNNRHLIEALNLLSQTKAEEVANSTDSLEESAIQRLYAIYPETCNYLGEPALRGLVRDSFEIACSYGLTTVKGMLLMVAFTIFVGHRFPVDPLYPWIGKRLEAGRGSDPEARTEELHTKATLYLRHALAEKAKG